MRKRMLAAVAVLMVINLFARAAHACELCRDSTPVATSANTQPAAVSFNQSIIWMLGGIGAVGSIAAVGVYRAVRSGG